MPNAGEVDPEDVRIPGGGVHTAIPYYTSIRRPRRQGRSPEGVPCHGDDHDAVLVAGREALGRTASRSPSGSPSR